MASSSEQCPLCNGLRGHKRLQDAMFKDFEADYKLAQREVEQLTKLYSDACWYNFETRCRSWKEPWHESWDASPISLRKYYTGSIRDAPALPPAIIFTELQHAKDYARYMHTQRFAPYDWAPGGICYEAMLRQSPGVAAYNALFLSAS